MIRSWRQIGIEPVSHATLPLIADWLCRPHVSQWWGEPKHEFAAIRAMVEGRDPTRPFVFSVDGVPVGYIQSWFAADNLVEPWLSRHPWLASLPPGTVGVDMSIGEPEWLGLGLGSAVLHAFAERLRSEGHASIIIDPDARNGRAVRAYERAGFMPDPAIIDPTGECLIMRFEPSRSAPRT